MRRGGFLLAQYNTKDSLLHPESMKVEDTKRNRKRSVFMQRNEKLLEEIKMSQTQRKLEYLDQVSVQQTMNIKFDKETWEKFHMVKNTAEQSKSVVTAFLDTNSDKHLIIYLGGSGQMMQTSKDQAIYAGGLGVNYKKTVVEFNNKGSFEESKLDCRILAHPYLSNNGKEIVMPNGRVGHLAVYSESQHAIYFFAGQLGREGVGVHHRELVNDLWKINLTTGKSNRVELSRSSSISRRMYTCGFMIS